MKKSEEEELMRRLGFYQNSTSNNITINNITNITNINVSGSRNPHWHGRRVGDHNRNRKSERPPKLTRHCATLGLLDGDIAYGMDPYERVIEGCKVVSYGARGIRRSACDMANSVECIARNLFAAISSFAEAGSILIRAIAK